MSPILLIARIEPGYMIITGGLVVIFLAWLIWPKNGLLALFNKTRQSNEKVFLEDSLKYLFNCEYSKTSCDINSIAGNLGISVEKATRLVERLLNMGLVSMFDNTLLLTDTGRTYALRIIRVHRIWERYLADETGVAQADWHNEADRIEHTVTEVDTEKLAALMGNPVFDPHGDPIPTADGILPEPKGVLLNCLTEGESCKIIHIEDEPRSIYEQLIVDGLYPGMYLYIIKNTDGKVTFATEGNELTLTPLFAGHITVERITEKIPETQKIEILSSLKIGENAEIAGISPNCRGQQRRRLMDMGVVPGSIISAEIKSPSGDPTGYRILGTTVGIRKQHADLIFIRKQKTNNYEYSK